MLSPKLLSLLESFSKYNLNRFRKFLLSPLYNENQSLIALFDNVDTFLRQEELKATPKFKQLDKKVVWKNLFGRAPYNDAHLRRLCSELLQLAYTFLYLEDCRSAEAQEKLVLLRYFKSPAMEKHFRGIFRQAKALQERDCQMGGQQYFYAYQLEQALHQQLEEGVDSMDDFTHLEQADVQLDRFYYAQKLKHYCDALGYENFLSQKPEITLPQGFIGQLELSGLLEEPLLRAYYLVARMLSHPEEERHFFNLKALFFRNHTNFAPEERQTLYIHLKNYCIHKKINAGVSAYFSELFDIFKQGMESGLLLKAEVLDPQDYKNIITVGLYVREFDWVERFIQQFTAQLPEANQENALTYNLAKVYFHKEQYEKVIEQLREVEYKSLVYALGGKLMLLKTYFELGEFLAMDSLIDSFRIYLRRKKEISREVRQQYLNVLRFVKKLSAVDTRNKEAIAKIQKEVEACTALAAKKWILEKIGEMG
ncbi:MAG: hypothetical protein KDD02_04875 [Phaeodactylibacter sp.]|nr:hypothetical protein [Phaeodactylibacter sp.]MCB9301846.1 hypothetical protein [Lewinellaceae bacterium]